MSELNDETILEILGVDITHTNDNESDLETRHTSAENPVLEIFITDDSSSRYKPLKVLENSFLLVTILEFVK